MKADVLLDLFFRDLPLAERVARIADAGWDGVETWKGGKADELREIGNACEENGMTFVSIVINGPGDQAPAPVDPEKHPVFFDQVDQFSDNALAAGCSSGVVTAGNHTGKDYYTQKQCLLEALAKAAEIAEKKDFLLNLEPLNNKVDHPGHFLVSRNEAVELVREVNSPNLRVLYDVYHHQVMCGDHLAFLAANLEWIGHFHAAGVPGRHEIFTSEIDYPYVIRRLGEMGCERWFGLEYKPQLEADESLRKTAEYLTVEA